MKFYCEGTDLANAVLKVSKAIGIKKPIPVLEGIKITTIGKEDKVVILATDGELTIEEKISASVLNEGETVVPGKYFSDFVKKLEHEQVEISLTQDGKMEIKYGENSTYMSVYNPEEYPIIDKDINEKSFTVTQKNFVELINKTVFAASTEDTRPILKGCLIEVENGYVKCVALDGFRMAISKRKLVQSKGDNFKAVVPARSLTEIVRLLDKKEEDVTVVLKKNALMVKIENTTIITRLLEGEYLNYTQILPKEFITKVNVNKTVFAISLDRVMVMSMVERTTLVKMDIKEEVMTMTAKSDIGNITENVYINLEGKDLSIAFNGKYIADYLRFIDGNTIDLNFNSPISPCVIKDADDEDSLYLVLPLRING